jgi:hypothetical protein
VKLFSVLLFFSAFILLSTEIRKTKVSPKPQVYPAPNMDKFHFGFSNVNGDLFWLRVLQNIDHCESDDKTPAVNKGTNLEEILNHEIEPSRCHMGWVYQMLDLVTSLAPKFRKVYRVGGELLSVAVDDREGARLLFEKGLKQFPDYWELAYSASYHYLFEYQNPKRAAELLLQAAEAGGPFWFRQMAATLFSRSGQLVMAESTLKSYIYQYWGQRGVEQAKMRLGELYRKQGLSEERANRKVELVVEETLANRKLDGLED